MQNLENCAQLFTDLMSVLSCICRLILHSDEVNPYLSGLEEFGEELHHFKPMLIVVGGLQMMDNFPYKRSEYSVEDFCLDTLSEHISKSLFENALEFFTHSDCCWGSADDGHLSIQMK